MFMKQLVRKAKLLPRSSNVYGFFGGLEDCSELLLYCNNNGYFRIVDLLSLKVLLSFKTCFGGIIDFTVEGGKSPLVALACQDDSVIILNMETSEHLRVFGHSNFVTSCVFADHSDLEFMLVSTSLDGCMSSVVIQRSALRLDPLQGKGEQNLKRSPEGPLVSRYASSVKDVELTPNQLTLVCEYVGMYRCLSHNSLILLFSYDGWMRVLRLSIKHSEKDPLEDSLVQINQEGLPITIHPSQRKLSLLKEMKTEKSVRKIS